MVSINYGGAGHVDPVLAQLCVRAYRGDNAAMAALEARALAGDADALSLVKVANAPSEPAQAAVFVAEERRMLVDLLKRYPKF